MVRASCSSCGRCRGRGREWPVFVDETEHRDYLMCAAVLSPADVPAVLAVWRTGSVLREAGYPINTEFGGHGIGSTMHQDPHVANTGRPGRGYRLRPGLLLALEPWVMADTAELTTDAARWTLRSATGCRTAHSEHTIAITTGGADILTAPTQVFS